MSTQQFLCGICHKLCDCNDNVHYDTNEFCVHCGKYLCIEHRKIILFLDAYILEVHCPECVTKCEICGKYGCSYTKDWCIGTCETLKYIEQITKCEKCKKNICHKCDGECNEYSCSHTDKKNDDEQGSPSFLMIN